MIPVSRLCQYTFLLGLFSFIASLTAIIVVFAFDADRFPRIPWGGFSLIVGVASAIPSALLGFAAA
jgi:spermidine/putrescine transport system permease protein